MSPDVSVESTESQVFREIMVSYCPLRISAYQPGYSKCPPTFTPVIVKSRKRASRWRRLEDLPYLRRDPELMAPASLRCARSMHYTGDLCYKRFHYDNHS